MIRFLIVGVFLMLAGTHSVFATELQGVLRSIANKPVKSSYFTETRTVYFLENPIVTKGNLEFRPPDTLIKRIMHPELIEQHIEGEILTIYQGGNIKNTISLAKKSELATGINAIRWVLSGNLLELNKHFDVKFDNNNSNWMIDLVPSDPEVAMNIDRISISGNDDDITNINIRQVNGDSIKTDIYERN